MKRDMVKRHGDIDMETWKVLLAEALVSAWDFDEEYQKELMRLSDACALSLQLEQAVLSIAETPICPQPSGASLKLSINAVWLKSHKSRQSEENPGCLGNIQ